MKNLCTGWYNTVQGAVLPHYSISGFCFFHVNLRCCSTAA